MSELTQLRNNIDFASISQFLHTFQSAFGPWSQQIIYPRSSEQLGDRFETEDLESMFLQASDRSRLEDMIVRMLRILTRNRFINQSSWQNYFSKEFDKREPEEENPLYTIKKEEEEEEETMIEDKRVAVNYFTLDLDVRIHLIYLLCEWQLDEPEKLREHLETEDDCVQWRVEPIGFDKRGDVFWLFDDNRLYKESLTKPRPKKKAVIKKGKSSTKASRRSARNIKQDQALEEEEEEEEWKPWRLLCATSAEWEHIPERFASSTHVDEKRFHDLLVNDVLPKVLPVVIEHEKELKKREAIIHRKRSSRIMIKELEALERGNSVELENDSQTGRSSSRIEKKAVQKEEKEREMLQKAREERLLEREKRTMEREYRRLAREKREEENMEGAVVPNNNQSENNGTIPPLKLIVKNNSSSSTTPQNKKKRGRKPKARNIDSSEESWEFDCICGVKGENLDDGSPMIACERCGIWQHIKCLRKYGQVHANKKTLDSITFVCRSCKIKNGEHVEPIRPVKRQKTNKQQQNDQVMLPSIQIWDRLQSPQITVISSQLPLQPQPTRPLLQVPPQPILPPPTTTTTSSQLNIQSNQPIIHPIIEPRHTDQPQQPVPILEPQPSILEPSFQSQQLPYPPPILPQPVLPSQQPPSKTLIIQSDNNNYNNTSPSIVQPVLIPQASTTTIIPEQPTTKEKEPVVVVAKKDEVQNVTPTQPLTDVTLESQENSSVVPLSNHS